MRRIKEVAEKTAAVYGGTVSIEWISQVPPLICDHDLVESVIGYMKELPVPNMAFYPNVTASASEDFSIVSEKVPTAFIYLSSGFSDERGDYPAHNPKAMFNEDVCPNGAAFLTHCAKRWLEDHD